MEDLIQKISSPHGILPSKLSAVLLIPIYDADKIALVSIGVG